MKRTAAFFLLLFSACTDRPSSADPVIQPANRPSDSPAVKRAAHNPYAAIDFSPMDISYFPVDYPKLKMTKATNEPPAARVIYSRPQRQGRRIFGALLQWGEPWRLGANEATEIEFFRPVTIQKKQIPRGRYTLYAIPEQKSWTIVFNSNLDSWGLQPDPKKDLYRLQAPTRPTQSPVEFFSMVFQKTDKGADLVMAWDEVEARLPIQF